MTSAESLRYVRERRLATRPGCMQLSVFDPVQTILELFDPRTASDPARAKQLQADLHNIQSSTEAWGLISGLSGHEVGLGWTHHHQKYG